METGSQFLLLIFGCALVLILAIRGIQAIIKDINS